MGIKPHITNNRPAEDPGASIDCLRRATISSHLTKYLIKWNRGKGQTNHANHQPHDGNHHAFDSGVT